MFSVGHRHLCQYITTGLSFQTVYLGYCINTRAELTPYRAMWTGMVVGSCVLWSRIFIAKTNICNIIVAYACTLAASYDITYSRSSVLQYGGYRGQFSRCLVLATFKWHTACNAELNRFNVSKRFVQIPQQRCVELELIRKPLMWDLLGTDSIRIGAHR